MPALSPIDLHCHSTASDGVLSPADVVARAAVNGVRVLALTDHDTVAGLEEAGKAAQRLGVQLVSGLELSVARPGGDLHVVGLGVDPADAGLRRLLAAQASARRERAERIAGKLADAGVPDPLAGAEREAGGADIGRVHFARHLVATGMVETLPAAFRRYLAGGQRAHVATRWVDMAEGIAVIQAAGGRAVLAHPTRYGLSAGALSRACEQFAAAGGDAIEVIVGGGGSGDRDAARRRAQRLGLMASQGSDFHDPTHSWRDLGHLGRLPPDLPPVWQGWPDVEAALAWEREGIPAEG
ncbi:PHP domain-containing protein [Arhodomonas sp. SL1]|uniref:PHP domain-containing protein n=1 Tax=Arhodomonas sp. SL1 TaxID=3425691 RepID=UPI003F883FEF